MLILTPSNTHAVLIITYNHTLTRIHNATRGHFCTDIHVTVAYRRCHEKTSYVSNYAVFTLLRKRVDRGQTHHFEKLQ